MKRRSLLRNILSLELVVIWLIKGTMSSFSYSNNALSFYSNNGGFAPSLQISQLALVTLLLPWANSARTTVETSNQTESETMGTGRAYKTTSLAALRAGLGMPHKKTTASNALLANIDFLTQLTNSKQGKSTEMDPLKCFPKALCGLSAESAAITRQRKNSLITDYIRLMKAVSLNPNVMEDTMKKLKDEERVQHEEGETSSGSDEDDDDDDDDEDDEVDDRRRSQISQLQKRKSLAAVKIQKKKGSTPKTKKPSLLTKKNKTAKTSEELTKEYLKEKAYVAKLMGDGFQDEETSAQNWWHYEKEKEDEESLEAMVDFSGTKLDSQSQESFYTFGGKRRPRPPTAPEKPETPHEPQAPKVPRHSIPSIQPPPLPKPPVNPLHRYKQSQQESSPVGNFFRSLFGFGQDNSFSKDPFFSGFKRSLPDGTPTVVTVDKTKEILTTAIEIGETLKSPNQCNSLFNGCAYQYIELLHVIDDIRASLADKGKQNFQTSLFQGIEEYTENTSGGLTPGSKKGSYGYKSSLSETSQAETLAPDYKASESQLSKAKKRRQLQRKKKAYKSYRNGKMSSASQETSIEIGSNEPTMYGSAQQTYDINQHQHGHGDRIHNYRIDDSYNQPSGSSSNFQYDDGSMYTRQPKSIWATILSWFGFGR